MLKGGKNLLADGHGGESISINNINYVPWNFNNLPNDSCSKCTPEVSSKDAEDEVDADCLSTGIQEAQNIEDTTAHELNIDQPELNLLTVNELTLASNNRR